MNESASSPSATERVRISCPGCGRGDWVSWPQGQDQYAWKCFNCHKEFQLEKSKKH